MTWTQVNWSAGNFIALSPGANELHFNAAMGTILNVEDPTTGYYGMLDRSGNPIPPSAIMDTRLDGDLTLFAALIQICALFIPFFAWFTWPYLVFACVDILNTQKPSWRLAPKLLGKRILALKSQLSVAFSLFLYGALGLLMFRVIAELILRISLPVGVLPNEMVALLPYTLVLHLQKYPCCQDNN